MDRESWNTLVVRIPTRATPHGGPFRIDLVPPDAAAPSPSGVLEQSLQRADTLAQLRVVRHRLESAAPARGPATPAGPAPAGGRIFAVSSARPREGKSTLAAQLAYVLSEADRARVLLVEATFARPGLAPVVGVGVPEGSGFSEQITRRMFCEGVGEAGAWRAVQVTPALALLAEPVHAHAPLAPHALYSAHFAALLKGAATLFDFVVVDAPEVLGSSDASVVADLVGGVVLAARAGLSRGSDLRDARRELGDKVIGVVLVAAAG